MLKEIESNWVFLAVASLTWLLFILGVAQLSRFYSKVMEMRKELDANMITLAAQLKKLQATLSEVAIEQRRATRLMIEQVDLKKAEMTGEFEIIEEPVVPQAPPPAGAKIELPENKG